MNIFETKGGVLWIGGLGMFAFAFLSNAIVPMVMYKDLPEQPVLAYTAGEGGGTQQPVGLVAGNDRLMYYFREMSWRYPETFDKYYGEPSLENCAKALRLGRQLYIGEGCWHCHSQFVRPVSQESRRWGQVAETEEFQNELQRPVMFGTRRVGPDLSRESGRRSNDWHAVHFFKPILVSSRSPMPEYPWLFDGAPDKPNKRGIALITYVQWLGSWLETSPYYEEADDPAVVGD